MASATTTTDKGIGLALVLGVVAVLGALVMTVTAPAIEAAWGFAAAVAFAICSIVAIHVYSD